MASGEDVVLQVWLGVVWRQRRGRSLAAYSLLRASSSTCFCCFFVCDVVSSLG